MIRALLITVVVLGVTALLAPPTSAHTAMVRASPDRDAIAGGSISVLDLEFLDPVSDASVTVSYNGAPVAGQTTVAAGEVITFTLAQPLTQPGRYQVNYEMISFDSDFTTGGFFFTFDPAADPIGRIEPAGPGGLSSTTIALSVAGLTLLVGLLALFVWLIDKRRSEQLLEAIDDDAEEYWAEDYRADEYRADEYRAEDYRADEYRAEDYYR